MEVTLDINKTIEQNAAEYYERAKKAKKKIKGALKAFVDAEKELAKLRKEREHVQKEVEEQIVEEEELAEKKAQRKSFWYDKFRWFFASNGMLVVGGRDATSNDIIVKKHVADQDIVFHTEAPGSPFFVIKTEGKDVPQSVLAEVAQATATFSRAWKQNIAYVDVYWVKPEQISKTAESGEYLGKGAFMVRGKRNQSKQQLHLAVGMREDGRLMAGPPSAVKVHCSSCLALEQGDERKAAVCKKIVAKLGGSVDECEHILPAGDFRIKK